MATTKAYEIGDFAVALASNADGEVTAVDIDTDQVDEGLTNLYWTEARARGALSVTGDLSYDSSTGVLSYTSPTTVADISNHDTDDLSEGVNNLYFTSQRARDSLSAGSGISYTSSTGSIALAASGVTPTTYGSASAIPVITVDTFGRITNVTTTAVAGVDDFTYDDTTLEISTSDGSTYQVNLSAGNGINITNGVIEQADHIDYGLITGAVTITGDYGSI